MADRNHPANTNSNTNAGGGYIPNLPRPSAAAANNPRGSATLAGVRRNLFQGPQQQSKARRPAPVSSQNSAETVRLDADVPSLADSSEIVVRDRHGEIEWGEPPSPDLEDQADVPMDNRQEIERTTTCLLFFLVSTVRHGADRHIQRSGNGWPRQSSLIRSIVVRSLTSLRVSYDGPEILVTFQL